MSNLQTFYKKFAIHKKDRLSFQRVNNTIIGKKCPSNYINLGNLILSAFTNRPKFIGQIDAETGEEITFHQMREESVKLALWLKKRDIMRTLYFLMESKPDVIFIDDEIIAEFEMALIIARLHDKMRIFPKIIILDKKSGLTKGYDSLGSILNSEFDQFDIDMFTCAKHSEKERIITMYSSNTANYPGEAYICYGAFLAPSNNQTPVMKSDDIGLWYESLNWTHSLLLTIRCILYYVTAIKASTFSHENLCQIVDKYKVTWVFLKTNMCNKLSDTNIFKKYKLFSLKKVLFGDTAIRRDIHENLIKSLPNASIIQVYCLSETGVIAYQRHTGKIGSSGHVSNNIQLMFINSKTRQPVGPYTHGEIWCQSPIKLGGFDRVKKLQSKYDAKRSCEGWYYTGDVGYFNENGEIFVIGKLRDIIQFDGSSIVPTKIEDVLQRHPAVSEAAVVGIKDEVVGQLPTAFVTKMPGAKITKEELMEYVEDNMAGYYVLRGGLRFLKSKMPYLPNGRIDRLRVKHMPCESDEDEDYDEDYE